MSTSTTVESPSLITPIPPVEKLAPGTLKVIKRNGERAPYDADKIRIAIQNAYLATEGESAVESSKWRNLLEELPHQITDTFKRRMPSGGDIDIEHIQDQVELCLMRAGEQKVAREYVIYREEHRRLREESATEVKPGTLRVKQKNGTLKALSKTRLLKTVQEACQGFDTLDPEAIVEQTISNLYDGVPSSDVSNALVMVARTWVENEPDYSFVAARLLLDQLRSEVLGGFGIADQASQKDMRKYYPQALTAYIEKGIASDLLDSQLQSFDLVELGKAIVPERDFLFNYLGLQTLFDRYFIHHQDMRLELPQTFFMRVAMGLALREENKTERAIEFYNQLSTLDYMSSTPTLFNSGTVRSQLSSCYLTTIGDDLHDIYSAIRDNAMLSKYAGGLGNDWTPVRGINSYIKGTNGRSQGVVPFLKVANDTAVAVNQGGKRKGALCSYLEVWHCDIEEFLELRKNSGDDRRRTHDMNTACWVPDLFMQRVEEGGDWYLFSPNLTPDLHDLTGPEFERSYLAYQRKAEKGKLTHKKMPAKQLWRKMLTMLYETGHPWITFKDPCNLRSPQQHMGVIHSSNLCTEITLNTSKDEIAVCNLGSVNLPAHINEQGQIDKDKLRKTVQTAIRMLDNVIDINYYSVPQARKSNLRHRPIGLGLMGFQDVLFMKNLPYDCPEAIVFADQSMELISYYAIEASCQLAKERGSYETFEGSLWSQGILPIDSINLLQNARGNNLDQDRSQTLDWATLRSKVRTTGMRNSNVMAIAPTATISNICGVSQSIEPTFQNLYVKSNLSGEFTVVNPYLVRALKEKGLWDKVMVDDLKYYNGSVQNIERIPLGMKRLFATAFEVDASWLIDAASRRQKWIDQAQSLNLYIAKPSGKVLDTVYRYAWKKGLKTTYYLRSLSASNTEKSTLNRSELNAVQTEPKVCSILDPDCEACQ